MKRGNGVVNIGVVGFGGRSNVVMRGLLAQDKRIKLVGAFDTDPSAVERANKFLKLTDIRAYKSLAELIADPEIDWVFIGSFNCHHAEAIIAALDAGKHVFCEKPLATTLADCLAVRDAVKRASGTFAFGLVLRYSPHYQKIRQTLADGKLGQLISFEFNETLHPAHGGYIFGNWRRRTEVSGSHMLEKCCHDLDLANWMVGSVPSRVASFGGKRYFTKENANLGEELGLDSDGRSIYERWPDANRVNPFQGDANIMDHQVVILQYANGVCATFHTNVVSALAERRFYLLGTRGTLRGDSQDGTITLAKIGRELTTEDLSIPHDLNDLHGGGDNVMAAGLAATMLEGKKPLAGIDEAIQSAVVALAIDEAVSSGDVIDLQPYWDKFKSQ